MATVNELVAQVAAATSMSATTDAATIVLALNRSLRRISLEFETLKSTASVTPAVGATSVTTVSIAATNPYQINSVYMVLNGVYTELIPVSMSELLERRPQARPTAYAWEGGTTLELDGAWPAGGYTMTARYTGRVTAIAAGGAESTISGVDPMFHEDLLGALATCLILEELEGEEERAAYHRNLYRETAQVFRKFLFDRSGEGAPNGRAGAAHFHTQRPLGLR